MYADAGLTTPGLVGSYVDRELNDVTAFDDRRISQTIAGTRVDSPVELRSLMPWVLSRLGLQLPPRVTPGDLFAGPETQIAELYGGSTGETRSTPDERCDRVSYREGRFKGIQCSDGRREIYDLANDPSESNDLSPDRPDLVQHFEERIAERLETDTAADELDVPGLGPKEIERLRALGYIQ